MGSGCGRRRNRVVNSVIGRSKSESQISVALLWSMWLAGLLIIFYVFFSEAYSLQIFSLCLRSTECYALAFINFKPRYFRTRVSHMPLASNAMIEIYIACRC